MKGPSPNRQLLVDLLDEASRHRPLNDEESTALFRLSGRGVQPRVKELEAA